MPLRDDYVFGKRVCNNSSHYMYTEEEAGGAMMWCVPTTSVQKSNTCPSDILKKIIYVLKLNL